MALLVLAFRTMTVSAGMIAVTDIIALRAMVNVPTKGISAATLDIPYGLQVAEEDLVLVFF